MIASKTHMPHEDSLIFYLCMSQMAKIIVSSSITWHITKLQSLCYLIFCVLGTWCSPYQLNWFHNSKFTTCTAHAQHLVCFQLTSSDYPSAHEARDYMRAAEEIVGSPDFIELIDGTHFKLRRIPTNLSHVYNHKQSSVSENTSGEYRNTES